MGQSKDVVQRISAEGNAPDFIAAKALAQYTSGQESEAIKAVEQLVETQSENATVQLLGGIVLQAAERTEEALLLLSKHQGSLEATALIVQIHLQQNRTDLALKEVLAARKWAQDSLLVNIAESWVALRVGGERYQQAFYVFEEMAQGVSTSAAKSLVGQAVAELHLGRLPEAEAALQQAIEKDPTDVVRSTPIPIHSIISKKKARLTLQRCQEAIANFLVLNVISGRSAEEHQSYVISNPSSKPDSAE